MGRPYQEMAHPPMRLDEELAQATPDRDSVLTIGVFDGVHRGHRHLISQLIDEAKQKGRVAGVITFRNHPDSVFRADFRPQYITSLDERIRLIREIGVDFVVPITFDMELSKVRAKDFAALLQERLRMRGLVVGPDFAMGYKREGTVEVLTALGREAGFSVKMVGVLADGEEPVRSTTIRTLLTRGDVTAAASMLGRTFSLTGIVGEGAKRGRLLGYPTANLEVPPDMAIPADGIYATLAYVDSQRHMAATSIGTRPTFNETGRTIEAFLLNFSGNLYGKELRLEFVQRLRDELKFDTVEALLVQMDRDVIQTREILQVL